MGCSCAKLKVGRGENNKVKSPTKSSKLMNILQPKRSQMQGDVNLPPLKKKTTLDRPDDFGKLPVQITEEKEEQKD